MSSDFKLREELYVRRHVGPDLGGKLVGTERHQWTITDSLGRAPILTAADIPVLLSWFGEEMYQRHPTSEIEE